MRTLTFILVSLFLTTFTTTACESRLAESGVTQSDTSNSPDLGDGKADNPDATTSGTDVVDGVTEDPCSVTDEGVLFDYWGCCDPDKDNIVGRPGLKVEVTPVSNLCWNYALQEGVPGGFFQTNGSLVAVCDPNQDWETIVLTVGGDSREISNCWDSCPWVYNPGQQEVVCEADSGDRDNDKVSDDHDNCPDTPNKSQYDEDEDGVGDACDNCKGFSNPREDCDGDSETPDTQCNQDGDSKGDACDDDVDGDGFDDDRDNCPLVDNDQMDVDKDGFGDACDNCPLVDNDQMDSDGDGLGDACEEPE